MTYNFSLLGSTATAGDYTGLPSNQTVTFAAGQTEADFPITGPEINKVTADRSIVVTLAAWQAGINNSQRAAMVVHNIDQPTVTISGQNSGAAIPLDTENDPNKLVAVQLLAPAHDGDVTTYTLSWSPELKIWGSKPTADEMAQGHDLGWITASRGSGSYESDEKTFTAGKLPATVYAQAIGGSASVNSTGITLAAAVTVPATTAVGATQRSASGTASGTAQGIIINWSSTDVTNRIAGNVLVGQGISVSVTFLGPGVILSGKWDVGDDEPFKAISGSMIPVQMEDGDELSSSLHFYWVSGPPAGGSKKETITISADVLRYDRLLSNPLNDVTKFTARTNFDLFSPAWSTNVHLHGPGELPGSEFGVDYSIDAKVKTPDGFVSGLENSAQLVTSFKTMDGFPSKSYADALDTIYPYNSVDRPADDNFHEVLADLPGIGAPEGNGAINAHAEWHFADYLLFRPAGTDTIWVPLARNNWGFLLHIHDEDSTWKVQLDSTKTKDEDNEFEKWNIYPKWTNVVKFSDGY